MDAQGRLAWRYAGDLQWTEVGTREASTPKLKAAS
jgi:hypothetical protein